MSERSEAQDVLRGFIVSLACLEHFGAILNEWYRNYFDISQIHNIWNEPQIVHIYEIHENYLGKLLPVDQIFLDISVLFIPWVTHLFIALSGYNLARKSPIDLRHSLPNILKNYFILGALFFLEGFIVAPNYGLGITPYPITVWFLILSISTIIYSYAGIRGIIMGFLGLLITQAGEHLSLYQIPHPDALLQLIHPWAQQSTNPMTYLLDCFWGLIIGNTLFKFTHLKFKIKISLFMAGSLACILIYFYKIKSLFFVDAYSITLFDEKLSLHFFGTIFILLICGIILGIITEIREIKFHRLFNLFKWIGVNSLGIFLIHRLLFIKIMAPIRLHFGSYFEVPMTNTSLELILYFGVTIIFYWLMKRFGFFGRLINR